jgi:hypothetical protein
MAYQNVSTPRLFINNLEWLSSRGYITGLDSIYRTLPVKIKDFTEESINVTGLTSKSFIAILGHTLYTDEIDYTVTGETLTSFINGTPASGYNGFSISTFDGADSDSIEVKNISAAGSIMVGNYYDFPNSPDLNVTLAYEGSGFKAIETKSGNTLTNTNWITQPMWGDLGAWELDSGSADSKQKLARGGRRVWTLSFSYLDSSNIFPDSASVNYFEAYVSANASEGNMLLDSDDFFSQVVHKTNNFQLPMMFMPDKDNTNPDQFAIVTIDQKSIQFQQVAHNVYSFKLKLREVW